MARRDETPRDLLFGLLALQNGLIDQEQLIGAFSAWTRARSKTLAEILIERGAIDAESRSILAAMAEKQLKLHGGDTEKSLAAVAAGPSTLDKLAALGNPDLTASVACVGSHTPSPDATPTMSVGTSTSEGQRFRVLRPHAQGGLGAVFVALDGELNREVALKQILDHHADDQVSRTRFLLEAEITGGLEHPGIVPVYGLGHYGDGRPYYAMRFIRGDSLKEAIAAFHVDEPLKKDPGKRSLALRKLLRRFVDVCNAIDYAHGRGVLHRDLKPGNVIVGRYGETLVVDWGLAKAMGRAEVGSTNDERTLIPSSSSGSAETLPGSAIGTPSYMSPEQATGDLEKLGPRSDVYGLGATLYCLLTGKPPFEGNDLGTVLREVQKGTFPPPRQVDPSIDRALEAVCLKAMATRPEDRYATARALADDVERWAADEPTSAWAEPFSLRARRWARRNRTAVAAAAVALVVGVVGLSAVLAVQTKAKNELSASLARETKAKNELSASLDRETKANTALAAANAELTRSKSAVQVRYDLAVEAIKTFHTGVSGDFLLKEDKFKDLRDRLLKSAGDFYERLGALLKDAADQPSRRALLQANYELADLANKVGRKEDALSLHRRVLTGREALVASPDADPETAVDVARSLMAVGVALQDTGKNDEARAAYEKARSCLATADGAAPEGAAARSAFAEASFRTGWLLKDIGRTAEALRALEQARDLQKGLASVDPNDKDRQSSLARTQTAIANLLLETGKPAEALATFEDALAIRRGLAEANPAINEYQRDLAVAHFNLGAVLYYNGKRTESLARIEAARAIHQKLVEANPAVTLFQADLAKYRSSSGVILGQTGKPAEALAEYEAAGEIRRKLAEANPAVSGLQADLAESYGYIGWTLFSTGKPAEAREAYRRSLAIWQKLADNNPSVTRFQGGLAGIHSSIGWLLSQTGEAEQAETEYRKAMAIQQKLVDGNPSVTSFRTGLAETHWSLAKLMSVMGKRSVAEAENRLAVSLYQKVVDADPGVDHYRGRLGFAHLDFGNLLKEIARPSEAEVEYREALAIFRGLTEKNPTITDYRTGLGNARTGLANLKQGSGTPAEAEAEYRAALVPYQQAVDADPAVSLHRSNLANAHYNLGMQLARMGNLPDGEVEQRKGLVIFQKLVEDNPSETDHRRRLAESHCELGLLFSRSGRLENAEAEQRKALAIYQKLADENPKVPGYRNGIAGAFTDIADLHRRLSRTAEAREGYERAIAIREALVQANESDPSYRRGLAYSLRGLGLARRVAGDAAGAVAATRRAQSLFEGLPFRSGSQWYELACCRAALAGLTGLAGSGLSAGDAEPEADQAMKLLRQAIANGYCDSLVMRQEDALDPLRSRPDFRLLMRDLAFPSDPFAR